MAEPAGYDRPPCRSLPIPAGLPPTVDFAMAMLPGSTCRSAALGPKRPRSAGSSGRSPNLGEGTDRPAQRAARHSLGAVGVEAAERSRRNARRVFGEREASAKRRGGQGRALEPRVAVIGDQDMEAVDLWPQSPVPASARRRMALRGRSPRPTASPSPSSPVELVSSSTEPGRTARLPWYGGHGRRRRRARNRCRSRATWASGQAGHPERRCLSPRPWRLKFRW